VVANRPKCKEENTAALLTRLEDRVLDRLAGAARRLLGEGLQVVEAADEQQVCDLLDHLERV
jgi:hypothetical protein